MAGFLIGGPISDVLISLGESTASAYRSSFLVSGLIILFGTVALLSVKRK